jgi:hypothetical protein
LAYVTGLVNQELLLQNEYLAAENRILKTCLQPGWRLSDGERATLAEIGRALRTQRPAAGRGHVFTVPIRFWLPTAGQEWPWKRREDASISPRS